jgi:hypothetical protein
LNEIEMPLVLESSEDPDSVPSFEVVGNIVCVNLRPESRFVVAPPARLLVSDPATLTEFPCKMLVDGGSVVAIVSNVSGVEVVLQVELPRFQGETFICTFKNERSFLNVTLLS